MNEEKNMVNFDYLRPQKAAAVKNWYRKSFIKRDKLTAKAYGNATILPLKRFDGETLSFGRGGVIDCAGNYIEESALKRRIEGSYPFEKAEKRNEKVVYCGYLIRQWGHFLVEASTRLWYFLKDDTTVDKYVFIVKEGEIWEPYGNYREFFELLGVWDKIEIIDKPVQYSEVIVPEVGLLLRSYYSDEYKSLFETIASNVVAKPEWIKYEKIFLSRSKIKGFDKKEYNMDMLDEFFGKNGYKVIYPENHSLSNLIFLLQNADVIASLSGSVQHNMMFAPDCVKHIIIEKTVVTVDYQIDINIAKNFDVIYIDANLAIFPVSIGYGPYMMIYSGMLKKFAEDYQYLPADEHFENKKRMRKFLKRYMNVYRAEYQYMWYIADWEMEFVASIKEACDDGYRYFEPYLSGQKPFLWHHYFEIHYWKVLIKSFIRRK